MKKLGIATIAAAGLSAAVLGLAAPASATMSAAMSGTESARETIMGLQAMGYRVLVMNPTNRPLDEATVVNVHKGNEVHGWIWDAQHEDQFRTVLYTNVFVDVR